MNYILSLITFDPEADLHDHLKLMSEKEACVTKQDQIDFMYRHYAPGVIHPRRLAEDYVFWEYDMGN